MTERKSTVPSDNEIQEYLFSKNLSISSKIREGHMGLPIYRCKDSEGKMFVIKIGIGEDGKREVEDNLFGYEQISLVGGSLIVPNDVTTLKTPWGDAILTPDLGIDFRKSSTGASETRTNFDTLINTVREIVSNTKVKNQGAHTEGVVETISQLKKWLFELVEAGMMDAQTIKHLDQLNTEQISSQFATVMILDFTPDNVFIVNDSAKFIDPWRQTRYLGTPIPGLSQFVTLAEKVYGIPGFNNQNLKYEAFISEIGKAIGLSPEQIRVQKNLGSALQYSLSSYVRTKSNPNLAQVYANQSKNKIEEATILCLKE